MEGRAGASGGLTTFRVLGPVEVVGPDGDLPVRGAVRRALLVRLLVAANTPVRADRLLEDVWGDAAPTTSTSNLSSQVTLLRRLLGADRLLHDGVGYRIVVETDELDALAFESTVADAHRLMARADPAAAAGRFAAALALWRGPALADVADAPWAAGEIARLEELRLDAEESLLEARLELGGHAEVVPEAERAVADHPLRERRWALLMTALYRTGRQADALRAFQRLRRLLDEELGIEPSPELVALEDAVLRQQPELAARPAGRRPAATVADAGPSGAPPAPAPGTTPAPPGPAPFPEPLSAAGTVVVGRDAELARLAGLLAEAGRGTRQLVVLAGEPGIGKTTLAARVARDAHAAGATVLYGRCLEGLASPYHPFVESIGHYVRHAPAPVLARHVAEFGGAAGRLVPGLARRVDLPPSPSTDPETERSLALHAMVGLLEAAAADGAVVLLLDDLHWADPGSLQLLRLLAASATGRLAVLATYRSTDVGTDHPLAPVLADLWREDGVTRVEVAGLSAAGVSELCGRTGATPGAVSVADLHRDTGGNPFYVTELLRHLSEADPGAAGDPESLPTSVREVIAQRIAHLGPSTAGLLGVAAVVGDEFDAEVVARATGTDADSVLGHLEAAERASLTVGAPGGTFRFAHALVRRTLVGDLPAATRRRNHGRVARALEDGPPGGRTPARLAGHYRDAGDRASTLRWSEAAGYDALDALAPEDAVGWFRQARELLERDHPGDHLRWCDVSTALGRAQALAGDPGFRPTLLEATRRAGERGDTLRMARAALANSRGFFSWAGRIDEERVALLRDALDRAGDTDRAVRARLRATLAGELAFDVPLGERLALAAEAVADAEASGDPATVVEVVAAAHESIRHPSTLAGRLAGSARALDLARSVGDPALEFTAMSGRIITLLEAARVPEAVELAERYGALAGEVGLPFMRWRAASLAANLAFIRGAADEGEASARLAYEQGAAIGQPDAFNMLAAQVDHARWQQGRLAELVPLIERGARENPGIPAYEGVLARAMAQSGRVDEAWALVDKATVRRFEQLRDDPLWAYGSVCFAEAALSVGHRGAAAVLHGQLLPYADQLATYLPTTEGPVAHVAGALAGLLGDLDGADRLLQLAARLADVAGSPFFAARTAVEQGRNDLRRGDRDAAARRFDHARSVAGRHGFAEVVAAAGAGLADTDPA